MDYDGPAAKVVSLPGGGDGRGVARLAALPGVSTASRVAKRAVRDDGFGEGRLWPVVPALADLLPGAGLRRGSTVVVHGSTSLLFGLLAEATVAGAWVAVVGVPGLGIAAAAEHGVVPARMAVIPRPGVAYPAVLAALLDGVDLVVTGERAVQGDLARRLSARARHRGSVLFSLGAWPGADLELHCTPGAWVGLTGYGAGHLRTRPVDVYVRGRGAAARPRSASVLLPGPRGCAVRSGGSVRDEAEAAG